MITKMKKQAYNPYLPSYEYVPDGEPYVFGDRLYVYGSHDKFNGDTFCVNDYVCWSASVDDLGDWRFEGIIFNFCGSGGGAVGTVRFLWTYQASGWHALRTEKRRCL